MRFFLIDRITRWEVGRSAEALKNVALSEDFFDDHFPRHPLMPAVLILEGMAQLSGLLLEASRADRFGGEAKAVLTILGRCKFRAKVRPGDTLLYEAQVVSFNETAGKARVVARRGETAIARTEMIFAFQAVLDPRLDEKRRELLSMWMRA